MRAISAADLLRSSPSENSTTSADRPALAALLGARWRALPSHSVLDIRGPSGCGKSLLAIQLVAEELIRSCDLQSLAVELARSLRPASHADGSSKHEFVHASGEFRAIPHAPELGPFDSCPSCSAGLSETTHFVSAAKGSSGLIITSLSSIRVSASIVAADGCPRPPWAARTGDTAALRSHLDRLQPAPRGALYLDFDCKVDVARLLRPMLRSQLAGLVAQYLASEGGKAAGLPSGGAAAHSSVASNAAASHAGAGAGAGAHADALLGAAVDDCLRRLLLLRPSSIGQACEWLRAAAALNQRHGSRLAPVGAGAAAKAVSSSGVGAGGGAASGSGASAARSLPPPDPPPWPADLRLALSLVILDGSRSLALEEVSLALGGSTRSYRDVAKAIEDRARQLVPPADAGLAAAVQASSGAGATGSSSVAAAASGAGAGAGTAAAGSAAMTSSAWSSCAVAQLFAGHPSCSVISCNRPLPTEAAPAWQQGRQAQADGGADEAAAGAGAGAGGGIESVTAADLRGGPLSRLLAESAAAGGIMQFRWRLLPLSAGVDARALLPPASLLPPKAESSPAFRPLPCIWAVDGDATGASASSSDLPLVAGVLLQPVGVVDLPAPTARSVAAASGAPVRPPAPAEASAILSQVTKHGSSSLPLPSAATVRSNMDAHMHWLLCAGAAC